MPYMTAARCRASACKACNRMYVSLSKIARSVVNHRGELQQAIRLPMGGRRIHPQRSYRMQRLQAEVLDHGH